MQQPEQTPMVVLVQAALPQTPRLEEELQLQRVLPIMKHKPEIACFYLAQNFLKICFLTYSTWKYTIYSFLMRPTARHTTTTITQLPL